MTMLFVVWGIVKWMVCDTKYWYFDVLTAGEEFSLYSRLMNGEQRESILFEAAKNGNENTYFSQSI